MLVQVLARTDAEEEPTREHRRCRRGRLGDDRGMDPQDRARHPRADDEPLGGRRDAPEHAPHERALALAVDPRVEVVRDEREAEARLLGPDGVPDEVERPVLLARDRVSELHKCLLAGVPLFPASCRRQTRPGFSRGRIRVLRLGNLERAGSCETGRC